MKIGILQTDSVLDEFRTQFGDYPDMFQSLFLRVDSSLIFEVFNVVQGRYPDRIDDCDGYVITGSKASVYDNDAWITTLGNYTKELNAQNKKLVAVCFGHQLIAEVFGGKTEKSPKGWGVGVHTISVFVEKLWLQPRKETFNVVVSHQDQVTRLPHGAELIAGSEFCENSMFQLGENILTIQGHPEFSKGYSRTMMRYRAQKIGDAKLTAGIESLKKSVDDLLVAQWLLAFLKGKK